MVEMVMPLEWKDKYMDKMYLLSFNGERPKALERCDFALVYKKDDNPVGFVTCHEMDSETLYWQYGGAINEVKKTHTVIDNYISFIMWSRERYKRVATRVENTNIPMLKIALKCGFLIVGTYNFNNKIFLELTQEF